MTPEKHISAEALIAIEACRPDSDDAALAEVAAILDREPPEPVAAARKSIERVDRAIMAAAQNLPVPEGLEDRILANLRSAADTDRVEVAGRASVVPLLVASHRRKWLAAGACLVLAASLLVTVGYWFARSSLDADQLRAEARETYHADDHRAKLATGEAPVIVTGVSPNAIIGWRTAEVFNHEAFAFELVGRRRVRGTLYVLPLRSLWGPKLENLPATPAPHGTAGTTIAVWADDSNAYVMVVEGSDRDFWSLFSRNVAA